jgi:hypothetical protein
MRERENKPRDKQKRKGEVVVSPRHGMDGDEETIEGLRAQRDQLAAELVAALAQLDRIGFAVTSDGTGPLPAVPPQRARSRHAATAPRASRATHLRLVKLLIPGAALAGLKYAWQVHRAATVAAGVLTVAATGTTAAVVAATHGVVARALGAAAAVPADGLYSAAPIASGSSSPSPALPSSLRLAAVTKPRVNAVSAGPLITALPGPPVSVVPVQVPSPAGQQQQEQRQAPPAPDGTLTADVTALDLSGSGLGAITLTCNGGSCPWHVVPGRDVAADVQRGDLQDGQSVTVNLTVDPAALILGGDSTVKVWPGGITVAVSWSAPVVPSVDPSPVDTTVPDPAASVPGT